MAGRPTQYQKLSLRATADIKGLKTGVAGMRKEMRTLKGSMAAAQKQSNAFGKSMANMAKMGGSLAAALSVRVIAKFGTELFKLGETVRGVTKAFRGLNQPDLLNQLREATGGAVDNLLLMKSAIQAHNFDITLKELAKLLRFASIRASETGENIDHLVDSIILGLGRKSIMILDNLGISAIKLREETKKTGDFYKAFGKIIDEELAKSVITIEEAATSTAKLATAWKNVQIELGKSLTTGFDPLLEKAAEFFILWEQGLQNIKNARLNDLFRELAETQEKLLKGGSFIDKIPGMFAGTMNLFGDQRTEAERLSDTLVKITKQLNKLGFTPTGSRIPPKTTPPPPTTTPTPGISRPDSPILGIK